MMNNPLVSVIIPNYNHAEYLDERIQSILNQTYQNFELVILDDKSTDNSVEVINRYKDNPHISCIVVNTENSGSTFKQWHKGFELAKGDVVWIAESDDACEPTLLETLVRGYVDNNAVISFCRSCKYDNHGKRKFYDWQNILEADLVMPGKDFITQYMFERNCVANASSAIFNLDMAMSLDKQYMTMRGNGDWLFWVELMAKGNVVFNTNPLNFFRFHESNTTKLLGNKGVSAIEYKKVFDYIVSHYEISEDNVRNVKLHYVHNFMTADYASFSDRRKVFKIWDKYRIWRIYIFLSSLKDDILLFLKNII